MGLSTDFVIFSFMLLIADSRALICGDKNQCTCRKQLIFCKEAPDFDVSFRASKTLLLDLDGRLQPLHLALLDGYAKVVIVNAPLELCRDMELRRRASLPECPEEKSWSTVHPVLIESRTSGKRHGSTSPKDMNIDVSYLHIRADERTQEHVELSTRFSFSIASMVVLGVKMLVTGYILHKILVSLVQLHNRININNYLNDKPPCIVKFTVLYMGCLYRCIKFFFRCKPCTNLQAPCLAGIIKYL